MGNLSTTKNGSAFRPQDFIPLILALLLGNLAAPLRAQESLATGMIRGIIIDQTGVTVTGAHIKLTRDDDKSAVLETDSDEDGQFLFVNVAPGPFELTISSDGLATQVLAGTLQPAETHVIPSVRMLLARQLTEVTVTLPTVELAQEQIRDEEKQRVLGFIPNFYASYVPNAAPLSRRQKFELAWKSSTDPMTFVAVGALAGVYHGANRWKDYGTGAEGYVKRYGAVYANTLSGTYIGSAILPSLLKQDPRYFYRGKGTKWSRLRYAVSNTFMCKGDNGQWQPNYSNVGGAFLSGGLAYAYYPVSARHGSGLLLSTVAIRLTETTVASLFQEFVVTRFTPSLRTRSNP